MEARPGSLVGPETAECAPSQVSGLRLRVEQRLAQAHCQEVMGPGWSLSGSLRSVHLCCPSGKPAAPTIPPSHNIGSCDHTTTS